MDAVKGALGALVSTVCMYPLDVAKTRLQAHSAPRSAPSTPSQTPSKKRKGRRTGGGIVGVNGCSSSSSMNGAGNASGDAFTTEEEDDEVEDDEVEDNPHEDLDYHANLPEAFQAVVRSEGVEGLYAGLLASLCKNTATTFVFYYFYSALRPFFAALEAAAQRLAARVERGGGSSSSALPPRRLSCEVVLRALARTLPTVVSLLHGTLAACCTQVVVMPMDMVVTRMQARELKQAKKTKNQASSAPTAATTTAADRVLRALACGDDDDDAEESAGESNGCSDSGSATSVEAAATGSSGGSNGAHDSDESSDDPMLGGPPTPLLPPPLLSPSPPPPPSQFVASPQRWRRPGGFRNAVAEVYEEGGLLHFWSSLVPGLLVCVNPGIKQTIQSTLRNGRAKAEVPSGETMLHGLASAAVASLLTYPISMVKTQQQNFRPGLSPHPSFASFSSLDRASPLPTSDVPRSSGCGGGGRTLRPSARPKRLVALHHKAGSAAASAAAASAATTTTAPSGGGGDGGGSSALRVGAALPTGGVEGGGGPGEGPEAAGARLGVPSLAVCVAAILRDGGLPALYRGLWPDLVKKACTEAILSLVSA